jgi:hypothetical protein
MRLLGRTDTRIARIRLLNGAAMPLKDGAKTVPERITKRPDGASFGASFPGFPNDTGPNSVHIRFGSILHISFDSIFDYFFNSLFRQHQFHTPPWLDNRRPTAGIFSVVIERFSLEF